MGFYTTVSYGLLEINTTRSMQFRATHSTLLAYPGHNLGTDWEHQRANSENTQNTFRDFSEGTWIFSFLFVSRENICKEMVQKRPPWIFFVNWVPPPPPPTTPWPSWTRFSQKVSGNFSVEKRDTPPSQWSNPEQKKKSESWPKIKLYASLCNKIGTLHEATFNFCRA